MKKIAVITPYYKESIDILGQCHESVLSQNVDATHFLIADGFPQQEISTWNAKHVILPIAHNDNGNTPRGIGGVLAEIEGYDFIAYLDADNWFHKNHLISLLDLQVQTNAEVCCSFRTIYQWNGQPLLNVFDVDEANLNHVDTSCYLLHRNTFESINIWLKMPKKLGPICDRVYKAYLTHKKYQFAFSKQKTVAFRTQYKAHYLAANLAPPENAKDNPNDSTKWLHTVSGVRETVNALGFYPV